MCVCMAYALLRVELMKVKSPKSWQLISYWYGLTAPEDLVTFGHEVLTAVAMKSAALWVIPPCDPERRF
jgi:hypothetical protein